MAKNMKPGRRNLITDVEGIQVGHADNHKVLSGVSVVLPDEPAIAGVNISGGAPATRETDALEPGCLVEAIHGIVLAGGSVFGLEAASGVTSWLAEHGRGFAFGHQPHVCPVVPAANLFDLANGGNKDWGDLPPYRQWGIEACRSAAKDFRLGNQGAGLGALAGIYKGGIGSASVVYDGFTVGALAAVNSFGSPVIPGTDIFWAAPFEIEGEFDAAAQRNDGGKNALKDPLSATKAAKLKSSASAGANTTLCVVATDAILSPAQARRVAIMASDGMVRALRPVHTPYDGDVVYVLATGRKELGEPGPLSLSIIGTLAADVVARSIARGVYEAETVENWTSYRQMRTQKQA